MDFREKRKSLIVGLCMMVSSLVILLFSLHLPSTQRLGITGTGLIPVVVSIGMLILSVINSVSACIAHNESKPRQMPIRYIRWLVGVGLLIVYSLVLEVLGFLISTFGLLLLLVPLFGLTRMKNVFVYSFILTVTIWFLFSKVFGSYLPAGTIY